MPPVPGEILDFVIAWSEKRTRSESTRTTMSVATSVKRYIDSFAADAGPSRILSGSSPSFLSSFVNSCRFWLAANSIWATFVLAACVTVAMRLGIDKSWPLIGFVILLTAGLIFRELWKSKLRVDPSEKLSVSDDQGAASSSPRSAICYRGFFGRASLKTLLILTLGLASTGFLLWPCLTRGAFVSVPATLFFIVLPVGTSPITTGDSNMVYRPSGIFGLLHIIAPNDRNR